VAGFDMMSVPDGLEDAGMRLPRLRV